MHALGRAGCPSRVKTSEVAEVNTDNHTQTELPDKQWPEKQPLR
jgi:hypothetical protein